MIEPIRILADWLQHPTHGVNALLAAMPGDPGDPLPTLIATVLDETRDGPTALDLPPEDLERLPALLVRAVRPTDLAPSQVNLISLGEASLLVQYAIQEINPDEAMRQMYQTLYRAVPKSIARLLQTAEGDVARHRNQVQLIGLEALTHLDRFSKLESSYLIGGFVARFSVVDAWSGA